MVVEFATDRARHLAQTCITCADACLAENDVAELVQCIRLNQDCADVCVATGSVATRRGAAVRTSG